MLKTLLIAILGLVARHGAAQVNQNATCQPGFDWSFNSLGQSPCTIAEFLASVCTNEPYTLPPLAPGIVYLGPTVALANPCTCSSVFYSLLSACGVCQLNSFISWTRYQPNCTVVYSQVFTRPIPPDTRVPHYAYLDVTASNDFNTTLAEAAGGTESTSVPSPSAGGTSPTSGGSGGKKSHSGAIAGGVVGGILALILIGGFVYWLIRRKSQRAVAPADIDPAVTSEKPLTGPTTFQSTPLRLYNPSDPSTFPANNLNSNAHMSYNPYDYSQPSYQVPSGPPQASHPGIPEL